VLTRRPRRNGDGTSTLFLAFLLGTGIVAAAPLLTLSRLRNLDIPAALRLVE
jgi:hypothetical protein